MSTINPSLYSGQFYQISGGNSSKTSATSGASNSDALLQALDTSSTSGANNSLFGGDILDLSPEAQNLLAGFGADTDIGKPANNDSFVLTSDQQKQVASILAQYKDAPFNQDTYNQIQQDLKEEGLSPDTLAIKEKLQNLNPTSILIDTLDGNDGSAGIVDLSNTENDQVKADNYMKQIFEQWQKTSTTAGVGSGSSTDVLV